METLCKHRYGLKRDKLLALLKLESSGWLSNIIDDLVSSGFVEIQTPFGNKTKDALIKVKDNYCLFYINFKKKNHNAAIELQANTAHFKVWSGLSFENICFYHYAQIVGALGLSGIETSVYQWQHKGDTAMHGAQIDMLIKRSDKAIQLCEIKFNEHPFVISKKYALEVRTKASVFNYFTKNKYSIFTTFICAGGLLPNQESNTLVHATITLDNLFQY